MNVPVRLRLCSLQCLGWRAPVSNRNGATVAQKVRTLFIDDIGGSAAEETVRFGLDGTEYEIGLNAGHAQQPRTPGSGSALGRRQLLPGVHVRIRVGDGDRHVGGAALTAPCAGCAVR